MVSGDISFINIVKTIRAHFKFFVINIIIFNLIVVVVLLTMPQTYKATSIIVANSQIQSADNSVGLNSMVGLLGFSGMGGNSETSLLLTILSSMSIYEEVVHEYQLMDVFNSTDIQEATRSLKDKVDIVLGEYGEITISCLLKTSWFSNEKEQRKMAELASNIVNNLVSGIDKRYISISVKSAKEKREFLELRFETNIQTVEGIENQFEKFMIDNNIISIENQAAVVVELIASLLKEKTILEIKLSEIEKNTTQYQYSSIIRSIESIDRKIEELEISQNIDNSKLILAYDDIPVLSKDYEMFTRELEIHGELIKYLAIQLEEAKLNEKKQTPTLQIIDSATPPLKRFLPRRSFSAIIGGIISLFYAIAIILIYTNVKEYVKNHKD